MTRPRDPTGISLPVNRDWDVRVTRRAGWALARRLGFRSSDATVIATVISELARNILIHGEQGQITLTAVENGRRHGLSIQASDKGRGIPDVELALQKGYSTAGSPGHGLWGVRQLMDEFQIVCEPGNGTVVTVTKWLRG